MDGPTVGPGPSAVNNEQNGIHQKSPKTKILVRSFQGNRGWMDKLLGSGLGPGPSAVNNEQNGIHRVLLALTDARAAIVHESRDTTAVNV